MKIEDVTKELLMDADSRGYAWVGWSWLSMRGYETDPVKLALYDKIAELKEEMVKEGYVFKCDEW